MVTPPLPFTSATAVCAVVLFNILVMMSTSSAPKYPSPLTSPSDPQTRGFTKFAVTALAEFMVSEQEVPEQLPDHCLKRKPELGFAERLRTVPGRYDKAHVVELHVILPPYTGGLYDGYAGKTDVVRACIGCATVNDRSIKGAAL